MNTIRFTGRQVLCLTIVTLAGVLCSVIIHFSLFIGFLPGLIVLFSLGTSKKIPFKKLMAISLNGILKTKIVIMILLLVSFLLPSWYLAGTISQMVHVSIEFLTTAHFYVLTFLAALLFSMVLGTSIGTLSSIGVPIMGTAAVLHLSVAMTAGALISGAFVGDRTSPFSSSHQLLAHTIELPVQQLFKSMLPTTLLAVICSVIFYGLFDLTAMSTASDSLGYLKGESLDFVPFIPPLLLMILVLLRINIIYAFLSSILSAVFIAEYNGKAFLMIVQDFWHGINGLGGGLINMYQLLIFLALAGAYNGLLEELNVIQPFLDKWLNASESLTADTIKTMAASILISLIAANQTLPIILTGRSFLPHWSRKYGNRELARVLGDSTMLFPGMVPWSVLTIMCSTIIGVPVYRYLPAAVFLWILPCLTFTISIIKKSTGKKTSSSAAA